MAQYKVIASNLDGFAEGSTVDESVLVAAGINVAALIAGGHVDTLATKQPPKTDDKDK